MRSFTRAFVPLRPLVLRALVGYPMLRAMLVVVAGILAAIAGREAASGLESPMGVVLLSAILGMVDLRRRGEAVFWANLGYSPLVAAGLFGAAALVGEALLAMIRS